MALSKLKQQEDGDIKQKLFNQTLAIESVLLNLRKANILLNYWTQEYCYIENPDPQAALASASNMIKGTHYHQSAKWFMEYENITQFIEIVYDYVYQSKEALARLLDGSSV